METRKATARRRRPQAIVGLLGLLLGSLAAGQERTAPASALSVDPAAIRVSIGQASEPIVVTLTGTPGGGPVDVLLPEALAAHVHVEPRQPALVAQRGRPAAAGRFRLRASATAPAGRYRVSVRGGAPGAAAELLVEIVGSAAARRRGADAVRRPATARTSGGAAVETSGRVASPSTSVRRTPSVRKPSPAAQSQEVSGALPLAGLAKVAFAVADTPTSYALGAVEKTVYGGDLERPSDLTTIVGSTYGWSGTERLAWQSAHSQKYVWRWQVSLQPFPATQAGAELVEQKALAARPGANQVGTFLIDFMQIPPLGTPPATTSASGTTTVAAVPNVATGGGALTRDGGNRTTVPPPPPRGAATGAGSGANTAVAVDSVPEFPVDFHIRLVPLLASGASAGPPSNAVVLHYKPGPNPAAAGDLDYAKQVAAIDNAIENAKTQAGKLYSLQLLEFSPVVFADPNRWGCIEVVQTGPYNPWALKPGDEKCPEPYKGKGDSFEFSDLDPIKIATEMADIASGLYDDMKKGVLDLAMSALPCPADLEDECRGALSVAMDAALASAGIPPSLPNFEEIKTAAKGKLVDLAVETALNELPGGVVCKGVPQCEDELRKRIASGIDAGINTALPKSKEPQCGVSVEEANAHGREPLPCFNQIPGWKVKPAKGAVYEPATIRVRVRRNNVHTPADVEMSVCEVSVGLHLENDFPGGQLGGGVDYQKVGPAHLSGDAYQRPSVPIPALAPNESKILTLAFTDFARFKIPGFDTVHHPYIPKEHWYPLYFGAAGVLDARTSAEVVAGKESPLEKKDRVACSAPVSRPESMPPN